MTPQLHITVVNPPPLNGRKKPLTHRIGAS